MKLEEFITIIKKENLSEPIINKKPINLINVYGYFFENGIFIAYRTDDKSYMFLTKNFLSEEQVLDELLEWLRNKKIIDNL